MKGLLSIAGDHLHIATIAHWIESTLLHNIEVTHFHVIIMFSMGTASYRL
jgi:hypothetical protein